MNIFAIIHNVLLKIGIKIPLKYVNQFSVSLFVFLFWMTFLDGYNWIVQYKLKKTVSYLESEKVRYQTSLEKAIVDRETLRQNKEKYAREKYMMHKENEEVIIIEE
jgi:cell division protein DivIC